MVVTPAIEGVGRLLTVTNVVADAIQPSLLVTVTLYVPAIAVVAAFLVGFCKAEAKLFGPVQLYVSPEPPEAVTLKSIVLPIHSLSPKIFVIVTAGFMVATTAVRGLVQPTVLHST